MLGYPPHRADSGDSMESKKLIREEGSPHGVSGERLPVENSSENGPKWMHQRALRMTTLSLFRLSAVKLGSLPSPGDSSLRDIGRWLSFLYLCCVRSILFLW